MAKGVITLLGYRFSCGRMQNRQQCRTTQVFVPLVSPDGIITYGAVDQADAAGWRETAKQGWLCPEHARGTPGLRHTFTPEELRAAKAQ